MRSHTQGVPESASLQPSVGAPSTAPGDPGGPLGLSAGGAQADRMGAATACSGALTNGGLHGGTNSGAVGGTNGGGGMRGGVGGGASVGVAYSRKLLRAALRKQPPREQGAGTLPDQLSQPRVQVPIRKVAGEPGAGQGPGSPGLAARGRHAQLLAASRAALGAKPVPAAGVVGAVRELYAIRRFGASHVTAALAASGSALGSGVRSGQPDPAMKCGAGAQVAAGAAAWNGAAATTAGEDEGLVDWQQVGEVSMQM